MSKSIREQMNELAAAGELKVVATKSTNAVRNISTAKTPPKKHWTTAALAKLVLASRANTGIESLKTTLSPELCERLDAIDQEVAVIRGTTLEKKAEGPDKRLNQVERACEAALNLARSIREGVNARDVDLEQLKPLAKQMDGYLKTIKARLVEAGMPKPLAHEQVDGIIRAEEVNGFRAKYKRELDHAIKENRANAMFFIDQPVLPVFEDPVSADALLRAGLPVETMAGYPVILKQRILVVNPEVLAKRGLERETYVARSLAKLNERSAQKFTLVTQQAQANIKNHVFYYWIMPERTLDLMTNASGSPVGVREWGLAF